MPPSLINCLSLTFFFSEDTPLSQVKVGELPGWLSRRSFNPVSWGRACSRFYWRWSQRYVFPKYCGLTPFYQYCATLMVFFYAINYPRLSKYCSLKEFFVVL